MPENRETERDAKDRLAKLRSGTSSDTRRRLAGVQSRSSFRERMKDTFSTTTAERISSNSERISRLEADAHRSKFWDKVRQYQILGGIWVILVCIGIFVYWATIDRKVPIKIDEATFVRWTDDGSHAVVHFKGTRFGVCSGVVEQGILTNSIYETIPGDDFSKDDPRKTGSIDYNKEIPVPRSINLTYASNPKFPIYLVRKFVYTDCNPLMKLAPLTYELPKVELPMDKRPEGLIQLPMSPSVIQPNQNTEVPKDISPPTLPNSGAGDK